MSQEDNALQFVAGQQDAAVSERYRRLQAGLPVSDMSAGEAPDAVPGPMPTRTPVSTPTPTPATTPLPPANVGGVPVGGMEIAASMAGSSLEFLDPLPGLAGLVSLAAGRGLDGATKAIAAVQAALHPYLVYQPQTDAGKAGMTVIHKAFDLLDQASAVSGNFVQQHSQPFIGRTASEYAGAATMTGVQLAPALLGEGLKLAKGKLLAGETLTPSESAAVEKNIGEVGKALEGAKPEAAPTTATPTAAIPADTPDAPSTSTRTKPLVTGDTIHWDRVENPLQIQQLIAKHQADIMAAKRGVVPDAVLQQMADKLGVTVNDMLARPPGEPIIAEQALAHIQLTNSAAEAVRTSAAAALTGNVEAMDSFLRTLGAFFNVDAAARGVGGEAGRALRIFREVGFEPTTFGL